MIEIPTDLAAELAPLAWLRGRWEGTGVIDYEADGHHFQGEFVHRVTFDDDGAAQLRYHADAWMGDDGEGVRLLSESGFWRLATAHTESDAGPGLLPPRGARRLRTAEDVEALRTPDGAFPLEVSIARADGASELYLGRAQGARIDLATDAVIRPATAALYSAATRMYGLVEGHLLWAWDIAALGSSMASHASARLAKKVD